MIRHTLRLGFPVLAAGVLVLAGCADRDRPADSDPDSAAAAAVGDGDQEYEVVGTVLESPDHGPQLCHAVAESYPPQCSGPDVVGWDWSEVESESAQGTTWGEYRLVGTWDGERFTLTEPAEPAGADDRAPDEPEFTTPCPEPAGGWQPVDPGTTTQAALDEALVRAAGAQDYAGAWLDQSYLDELDDPDLESEGNDPTRLVLNLRFTGDLEERERWIREVWGGALCVSGATQTEAELREIQERLTEEIPDLQSSYVQVEENAVVAEVFVADPERQRELDQEHGEGVVVLRGWLQPR